MELFSKQDEQEVRKEQDRLKNELADCNEFQAHYMRRRRERAPGQPRGKAKAQAMAADRKRQWVRAGAPDRVPAGFIEHAMAKSLLPPGAYIWRMLTVGGWQCWTPPHPRVSFNFSRWGPRASVIKCLQHCWHLFLVDQGLNDDACPIKGMFDETFEPLVR